MRKKIELQVQQNRSITAFFNRVADIFDRKFDGFPAVLLGASSTPAFQEGSEDYDQFNSDDIIDKIANSYQDSAVPPCPDVLPPSGCYEGNCVVLDTFTRTDDSWDTTDSGHFWDSSVAGITETRPSTTVGMSGLLHSEPGFTTGATVVTNQAAEGLELEAESLLVLPFEVRFDLWYTGNWESTYAYNANTGTPSDTYWAPGVDDEPTLINGNTDSTYHQTYFRIRTRRSLPNHAFRIYNSGGSLWLARDYYTSAGGSSGPGIPEEISTQLPAETILHVKLYLSDKSRIRIWKEGETEPSFWQLETQFQGDVWGSADDKVVDFHSVAKVRNFNQPPFDLFIDNLCIIPIGECEDQASGTVLKGALIKEADTIYRTPTTAKYISDVWYDGMMAIKGVDYQVSEDNVVTPTSMLANDTVVTARYVQL